MARSKAPTKKQQKRGIDFKVMNYLLILVFYAPKVQHMKHMFFCLLCISFYCLQKIKRKIGRKLPPAQNATSTEIKSKGID